MVEEERFKEFLESVRQGCAILRGEAEPSRLFHVDGSLDIKQMRERNGLSQREFASALGISMRTLQNWEQGRRFPKGPARILLSIFDRYPEIFIDLPRSIGSGR